MPDKTADIGRSGLKVISRYWQTVRHLRPLQLFGRIKRRAWRPRPDLAPPPVLRRLSGPWSPPVARAPSLLAPATFNFLHVERALQLPGGWSDPTVDRLWRYNLHYFDDLNAVDAATRKVWHMNLLERWPVDNPPGKGVGWEPYPTSLRIVNWIKWALAGNDLPSICRHSLAVQTRWLLSRLEIHLLGNHLFANAKALLFAGLFFEGAEAARWLEKGLDILKRELPEQILADGGHFERSTMYHALVLEDLLDLCNVTGAFAVATPPGWPEIAMKMRRWLIAMCHPDGEIGFFNDAAFGIAAPPADLERYACDLGLEQLPFGNCESQLLAESGYVLLRQDALHALIDIAPVGPDYLPGHAHADTLSFELSLSGQRVIVNSGTSCYGSGPERLRQRGTAAHSTLVLNNFDSSEVWGDFRVARRARVLNPKVWKEAGTQYVMAGHDGYRHLPGGPLHWRSWKSETRRLTVTDRLEGCGEFQVGIFFHLHPDVRPEATADDSITVNDQNGTAICRVQTIPAGVLRIEPGTWHPEFGTSVPTTRLVFRGALTLPAEFIFMIEY